MSILWTIDEGRDPIVVCGRCTLIACEGAAHDRIWETIQEQVSWWNRQIQSVHLHRRHYQLRFHIVARRPTSTDRGAPHAGDPIWKSSQGDAARRLSAALGSHRDEGRGVALLLAGGVGPADEEGRSHTTYSRIINWTSRDIKRDREGLARSVVLAHEIGHVLGLRHTYDDRSRLPSRRADRFGRPFLTQSDPGWERNIMADVDADRQRSELPVGIPDRHRVWVGGRAWLGYTLARELLEEVTAMPSGGGVSAHGVAFHLEWVGRPPRRTTWGCSPR